MRYKIWHENDFFQFDERLEMDASVVELPDRLVVTWAYNHDPQNVLGKAFDIKLEAGAITAEVEWTTERMNDETFKAFAKDSNMRLAGYYIGVVQKKGRVMFCKLASASVIVDAQNPLTYEEQLA